MLDALTDEQLLLYIAEIEQRLRRARNERNRRARARRAIKERT